MVARPTRLQIFASKLNCASLPRPQGPAGNSTSEMIQEDRKNIDPEQVRKLAGWGLTENNKPASSAGVSPSSAWVFSRFTTLRRQAIKNGVEQGHGTQSNPLGMKDLWPLASRFWKNQARVRNGQQPRS